MLLCLTRPTAHATSKFLAKTERPLVILGPIMDDTFYNAFENCSEESGRHRFTRIKQESACKPMGVLHGY